MKKNKIIVAITGASGAIYAKVLLDKLQALQDQIDEVGVIMSDNAKYVWRTELDNETIITILLNFMKRWILKLHLPQDLLNTIL